MYAQPSSFDLNIDLAPKNFEYVDFVFDFFCQKVNGIEKILDSKETQSNVTSRELEDQELYELKTDER